MSNFHTIAISVVTESADHYLELIFFRDTTELIKKLDQCSWVDEPVSRYGIVLRDSAMNANPRLHSTCNEILKYRMNLI